MKTRLSRLARAGVAVVMVAAVAGCGGKVITAGGVTVLVAERTNAGMDARGGGRLEVVGGCLGASGSVILWPAGTKVVEEEPLTVDVPGEGQFAIGDDVVLGGGYVSELDGTSVAPTAAVDIAGVTVPAECAAHDIFLARRGG